MKKLKLLIINFFDFFHKFKILKFLKKNNFNKFDILFDVGAHHGESIKMFAENFDISNIFSFEASPINFKYLSKNKHLFDKKFVTTNILIENLALGSEQKNSTFKQSYESSSSTFNKINIDSKYFKRKKNFFGLKDKDNFFNEIEIQLSTLDSYILRNNINKIDFLKMDVEGYEYDILLGLKNNIKMTKLIMFEHHYDNMIVKNYKFSTINSLLLNNNFKQIYKSKMPFRKVFEYIYLNNDLSK